MERYGSSSEDDLPPIKVIVVEGKEDITIKISDEGGGIPRSAIPLIWTYMYTTMENPQDIEQDFTASDFQAPMAGFGYGLPLSRLVSNPNFPILNENVAYSCAVCQIFWWRPSFDFHGGFRD